jgi:hypothetical protein
MLQLMGEQISPAVFEKVRPGIGAHRRADPLRSQDFEEQRAGHAAVENWLPQQLALD